MRRKENRVVPLETVFEGVCSGSGRIVGPYVQGVAFPGMMIEPAQVAIVITAVDDVGVERIGYYIAAFESCGGFPIFIGDAGPGSPAFQADTGIILLRTQNMVGEGVIGTDPIDLGSGLIIYGAPILSPVEAYLGASVICEDHAAAVFRVKPQVVMITMGSIDAGEGFAAIYTLQHFYIETIDVVFVFRICINMSIINI